MAKLSAKTISAGDPVTSDLINNIINDLGLVYKETASQSIVLTPSSDSPGASLSSKVYSTPGVKKYIKAKTEPTITFKFTDGWFTKDPSCWVQVADGAKKLTEANLRFSVVLTDVTTKSATWTIYPASDQKAETLTFYMFAAGS